MSLPAFAGKNRRRAQKIKREKIMYTSYRLILLINLLLTVAAAMMSCNRKTVYDRYESTPVEGWERNDTLTFLIEPAENEKHKERNITQTVYKEEVGLRINSTYPFMSLSLIVEQTALPSCVTRNDTLNCRLVSADGRVKGRGVNCYQYLFHLTDITLAQDDSLCIRIRHNMKRETLPGISDVGIRLTRY